MSKEKVVQFVLFETPLDTDEFIEKWEKFTSSADSNNDVYLNRSEKNGLFNYLVQYHCSSGQFQFVFERVRRSSKTREAPLAMKQAGGYLLSQAGRTHKGRRDETKLFAFFSQMPSNIAAYSHLGIPNNLNIYEPYYENCCYACILEFFAKNKNVEALLGELKALTTTEIGMYKDCSLQLS